MIFEQKLKKLIKEKYKSVRAFSQEYNIPYSTIDNIFKRGIMGVSVQIVLNICNILNIDVEYIAKDELKFKSKCDYAADEQQLITDYRQLSEQGQESIRQQMVLHKNTYKKSDSNAAVGKEVG